MGCVVSLRNNVYILAQEHHRSHISESHSDPEVRAAGQLLTVQCLQLQRSRRSLSSCMRSAAATAAALDSPVRWRTNFRAMESLVWSGPPHGEWHL
jgi:hypothetical protein